MIAFQSAFLAEMYQNDIFLFLKIIFETRKSKRSEIYKKNYYFFKIEFFKNTDRLTFPNKQVPKPSIFIHKHTIIQSKTNIEMKQGKIGKEARLLVVVYDISWTTLKKFFRMESFVGEKIEKMGKNFFQI